MPIPLPAHTLSKSDFKLARTCPAKLYYRELRYPDTLTDDAYLEMLAEGGYMVELLAKQMFPEGITLDAREGTAAAIEESMRYLRTGEEVTLFEAMLYHEGRLARVDVLRRGARGLDLYEVKAKSFDPEDADKRLARTGSAFRSLTKPHDIARDWREYLEDVTYQVTILKDLFPGVPVRAHLILVDKSREATHDDMPSWFRIVRSADGRLHTAEFVGDAAMAREARLTAGLEITAEVESLEAEVREASAVFVASLRPTPRRLPAPLGGRCRDCEFRVDAAEPRNGFLECWGPRGHAEPHVLDLYQGREFREELIADGISAITEIDEARLAGRTGAYAERQRIQVQHARSGQEWIDEALAGHLERVRWPVHFIDFEAAGLAVPHHRGMRPYGRIAWQWSCHTIEAPGAAPQHTEYINTEPRWPNETFASSLRDAIGEHGSVLVWSPFEGSVLRGIADELAALGGGDAGLAAWLRATATSPRMPGARIVDLLQLCRDHYHHPAMRGSNSIKAVLDALWKHAPPVRERFRELTGIAGDPMRGPYAALPPLEINGSPQVVAEGTGAIRAYFAMVYGVERDDAETRERWRTLLLEYCKLDTLAMVLVWEHWRRVTGLA